MTGNSGDRTNGFGNAVASNVAPIWLDRLCVQGARGGRGQVGACSVSALVALVACNEATRGNADLHLHQYASESIHRVGEVVHRRSQAGNTVRRDPQADRRV